MSQTTHECGGDAAAYVLGALDSHELVTFRRHLETCSVCTEDVASLEKLTSVLPMSVPQFPASKHLRRSVMAEVRKDALARLGSAPAPAWKPFANARPSWAGNRGPRYLPGLVGGFAALVLVLVVVVAGITAGGSSKGSLKRSGSTHVYQASVGSGSFVSTGGQDTLIVHHLNALPATGTYEVWLKRGSGKPQPATLFNTNFTGDDAVKIPGNLHGVTQILVTQEPANGSFNPTGRVLVDTHIS